MPLRTACGGATPTCAWGHRRRRRRGRRVSFRGVSLGASVCMTNARQRAGGLQHKYRRGNGREIKQESCSSGGCRLAGRRQYFGAGALWARDSARVALAAGGRLSRSALDGRRDAGALGQRADDGVQRGPGGDPCRANELRHRADGLADADDGRWVGHGGDATGRTAAARSAVLPTAMRARVP